MVASSGGTYLDSLEEILPANRSTLSNTISNRILKKSKGNKRFQDVDHKRKDPVDDYDVVDLTGDHTPFRNKSRTKDMMVPCSSKHPKISQAIHHPLQACGNDDSIKKQHTEFSPKSSLFSCILGNNQLSSCIYEEHGSSGNRRSNTGSQSNVETVSSDDLMRGRSVIDAPSQSKDNSLPTPNERTRGSAFLLQVQERLTSAEYKEFVSLMKALKSKTMKIVPVLESIARLFSGPGRQSLLQGFKDYVPAKYRPFYEQHMDVISTLGDSEHGLNPAV